jgi:cytochrome c-type biogenesis protein CcmH
VYLRVVSRRKEGFIALFESCRKILLHNESTEIFLIIKGKKVDTFWLVAAVTIAVVGIALIFVWLPWLRKTQQGNLREPKGGMAILTGSQGPIIIGGVATILFAFAMFLTTTNKPATVATTTGIAQNVPLSPEHVEMIKALSARLAQDPNDGKGWAILARSYAVLGRYNEAVPAYEKAVNLIPNDPVMLVDYADILGVINGKNLQGKPTELIQKALLLDPGNVKGLNLMGTAAFQAGEYIHAESYWEKLLKLLPPDSPTAKQVSTSISNARTQALKVGEQKPTLSNNGEDQTTSGGAQISGEVRLSPALANKVAPTDTVFVFAKAMSGPPMPIAVIRAQVKDLPQKFTLNDSMAMMPTMKLSNFKEVAIGAKISKSGNATPQSGDLRGEISAVKIGTNNVQLVIDKVVP